MQKTLIVLVGLLGLISCTFLPLTQLAASKTGSLTANWVENGYVVDVDYTKDSAKSNTFLLTLHSSQQIFTRKDTCNGFTGDYNCKGQYDQVCEQADDEVAIKTPYFTGKGKTLKTTLYADYTNFFFEKATPAPAVVTTECTIEENFAKVLTTTKVNGVLGLGYDGDAAKNFKSANKNFWVDVRNGSTNVAFNHTNAAVPDNSKVIWNVKADKNWIITAETGLVFGDFKKTDKLNAMFDLNERTHGLPSAIFKEVVAQFNKWGGQCNEDTYTPKCKTIHVDKIQNLTLKINATYDIHLPAWQLVQEPIFLRSEIFDFKLNIRSLATDGKGLNFVTADFANHIIFGNRTLSPYIAVFNYEDGYITLWENKLAEQILEGLTALVKWLIVAAVVSVLVCCLCVCFCCGGAACIVSKITGKDSSKDNYYQGSSSNDPFVQNQPIRH